MGAECSTLLGLEPAEPRRVERADLATREGEISTIPAKKTISKSDGVGAGGARGPRRSSNVELPNREGEKEFSDKYTQLDQLGKGHFAQVFKGIENKTGKEVAIKYIIKRKSKAKHIDGEIEALKKVGKHPNVIELYDIYEFMNDRNQEVVVLVIELCQGGELFERLSRKGPYSELMCQTVFRDCAQAIAFLHENNVVHRDLKPENILLTTKEDDAVIKIADFGLSKIVTDDSMIKTRVGTWIYTAPEVRKPTKSYFGYTAKADVWSLGVLLFILLSGYHPFDPDSNRTDMKISAAIQSANFDFNYHTWENVSDEAKDLINKMIVANPEARLSSEEVLEHDWIQSATLSKAPLSPAIDKVLAKFHSKSSSNTVDVENVEVTLERPPKRS